MNQKQTFDFTKHDYSEDEEYYAMIIQGFWKLIRNKKVVRQVVPSLREKFHFFYSPININMKAATATNRLLNVVKGKKLKYFAFNLCDNPMTKSWVKDQLLNQDPLPYIFINGSYIGGMDELQILIDFKLLDPILNEEYLKKCLICPEPAEPRQSLTDQQCPKCQCNYKFFAKQKGGVLICPKCRKRQEDGTKQCDTCEVDCIRVNETLIHLSQIQ